MTLQEVLEAARALTPDEQAVVIHVLTKSVEAPPSPEIERAWAEEIERRIAAYDRGEVKLIDAEEVFARVRSRHQRRSSP